MKRESIKKLLNKKNETKSEFPGFYKLYIGDCNEEIVDEIGYYHPKIYRYIKISDLESSEKFFNAVKKFEESIKGYCYYTSFDENRDSKFTNFQYIFNPANGRCPIKQNFAFKKMLKVAKQENIKLYTRNQVNCMSEESVELNEEK